MKIKSKIRAGAGKSSKSANTVVTYISPLLAQYINRCSGI